MLRVIQKIVLLASLFIGTILTPHPLWACSMFCPPLDEFKLPLPAEKLESHDAVFLGTLVEKAERMQEEPCREKEDPFSSHPGTAAWRKQMMECNNGLSPQVNDHIYTFEIEKSWKGVEGKTISLYEIIDTICGGQTCGTPNMVLDDYPGPLELGKRYLVYADRFKGDNRWHPRWQATRRAKQAEVEIMFLNAAEENASVASVVKQLPEVFRIHSSPVTKAEAIKWLRHAPPATSTEDRRKFFIEALVRTDENLRNMKPPPVEVKDFEGLPGYQEYFEEDDTTILTAIALALGNEEFKGDQKVIHVLIYLLNGVEPRVNIAAAESLKRLGFKDKEADKRIYGVLKYGLTHTDRAIRSLASTALLTIKTPEAEIISLEDYKKNLSDDTSQEHKKLVDLLIEEQKKVLARKSESPTNP